MGVNRRAFIQMSLGGTAGILFTPVVWKFLDDASIWTQNWSWIPRLTYGEETGIPTISKMCPSGCAVSVETVAGKPYGTTGNADTPLGNGGLCPLCAVGVQLKNSPVRAAGPMKKVGEGKYEPTTWEEALSTLAGKVKGGKVAVVSGDATGTANEVLSAFASKLGGSFYQMPGEGLAADNAWLNVMNGAGKVGYDLENADYVLMVGADALDSWGTTTRNQSVFGSGKAAFDYAGPVQNRSAAVSGKWVPVSPDGYTAFLLGLCYYAIKAGATVSATDFYEFQNLVMTKFKPAQVEKATGVKAAELEAIAGKLIKARKPVVLAGSAFGQGAGAGTYIASIALNLLVEGGIVATPEMPQVVDGAMGAAAVAASDLAADVAAGKFSPSVALVYEANPVYALPEADKAAAAFAKAFTVSFSPYMDETAMQADLILPAPHPYERFDDVQTPYGLAQAFYAVNKPIVAPEKDVKSTPDFILELASKVGVDLGFESFEAVLQAKAEAIGADFDSLMEGEVYVSDTAAEVGSPNLGSGVLAKAAAAAKGAGQLLVAPQLMLNIGSPYLATPPHNATTIRDTELLGKDMFVAMNSATAKELGLTQGAAVKLTGGKGECKARVNISEGVMPGVVSVPVGFGHTAWDEFSKGKGDNVFKILGVSAEPGTGLATWTGSTANIAKI